MASVNRVVVVGHATRDAHVSYTPGGTAVAEFSVALNSREKSGDEWQDRADFFDVVVYGPQAEACGRYLKKGRPVGVDGRLRQERWETKDDPPQKRSKVRIVASTVQFLGKRDDDAADPEPKQEPDFAAASGDDIPF